MNGLFQDVFPQELILEIFSHVGFTDLKSSLSVVSKKTKEYATDLFVLKRVIYKEKTFNPENWINFFKVEVLESELKQAWESFPSTIGNIFNGPCPIFPNKTFGQTHLIVWIPASININNYGMLLQEKFPLRREGYEYIWNEVVKDFGSLQPCTSKWVVMTREAIPLSGDKTYFEQQAMVKDLENYSVASILETIICISTAIFKHEIILFDQWYLRCNEESIGHQVAINFWSPSGFYILPSPKTLQDPHVGIACTTTF